MKTHSRVLIIYILKKGGGRKGGLLSLHILKLHLGEREKTAFESGTAGEEVLSKML